MTKQTLFQIVLGLLVLALAFAAFAPESETSTLVAASLVAIVLFGVLSLGVERGTELLKIVLRFAFSKIPFLVSWQPSGVGSVILALIVSFAGIQGFNVEIFKDFDAFTKLDPDLVYMISIALTWLGSSLWHSALPPGTAKAQSVK